MSTTSVITLELLRTKYRNEIMKIAEECNAENIRVFGSVVRGDNRHDSDIDFLVHMKPGSGFCLGGLQWRLEELLGCEVDVVTDKSLYWAIKDDILKEAIKL